MTDAVVSSPAPTAPIERIAAAALVRDGQVLLVHRQPGRQHYPNCWDIVGGHIEPGESPADAIRRECREELGIDIDDPRPMPMAVSDPHIEMHAFVVTSWRGQPANTAPDEHDDLRWFDPIELGDLVLAHPASRPDLVSATTMPAMSLGNVRAAYSAAAGPYIDLLGGGWQDHEEDTALVRRHLTGLAGPVLDLGCGPGHWTAFLHALGADVTGVDIVPEFITHARDAHPGPRFLLGSMTEVDAAEHSVAGILAWYSTIHLPPPELKRALAEFRRLLSPSGVLVIGFFDSDGDVSEFDHKVTTAYRWPVDVLAEHLAEAGLREVQRIRHQFADRPDRRYAAIAACAS